MIQTRINQLLVENVPPDYDPGDPVDTSHVMLVGGHGQGRWGKDEREEDDDSGGGGGGGGDIDDVGDACVNYRVGFFWYGRQLPLSHGRVSQTAEL